MNTPKLFIVLCAAFAANVVQAKSDTDVTLIKCHSVIIADDTVTIVAEARTRITLIQEKAEFGVSNSVWMGQPVTGVTVKTGKVTFVINRPQLNYNDPDGTHAAEKAASQKVFDDAWAMTLQAANDLKEGKDVGRIGYYSPEIIIKGNLISAMTGYGYLYPKRKQMPAGYGLASAPLGGTVKK